MTKAKTRRHRTMEKNWKPTDHEVTADTIPKFSRICLFNGNCMVRRLPTLSELDKGSNDTEE